MKKNKSFKGNIQIGVFTISKMRFDEWVYENGKDGEQYHWIHDVESLCGVRFNDYEYAFGSILLESKVFEIAKSRLIE